VCVCLPALPALTAWFDCMQAPSCSPDVPYSDVPAQLPAISDVLEACEGLSIEAVIEAAERELKPSGSPGETGAVRAWVCGRGGPR